MIEVVSEIDLSELLPGVIYTLKWEHEGVSWVKYLRKTGSQITERNDGMSEWVDLQEGTEDLIEVHNEYVRTGNSNNRYWASGPTETLSISSGVLYFERDLKISNNRKESELFKVIDTMLKATIDAVLDCGDSVSVEELYAEYGELHHVERATLSEILK
ncbi:hypothetical protein PQC39_gp017 [Vibrio phage Vp_R1]|uniref:Uncharacterized protein n=1 Tax=Vibrio phage Vp_R1 TaxID=2059867 RepID=A0A2H5BPW9_9CAUD|nr:hypothetical protein PQC39_gp017 [Vibrio phage Vp_R1]AUG88381.1 hypothetical protein VPR_017 [Vibrio phage Vp_R1]